MLNVDKPVTDCGLSRLSGANCTYPVTGKAFLYDCRTYNRLSNRVSNIVIAHLHKEFCYFLQPAMCLHELPRLSGHLFGSGQRFSIHCINPRPRPPLHPPHPHPQPYSPAPLRQKGKEGSVQTENTNAHNEGVMLRAAVRLSCEQVVCLVSGGKDSFFSMIECHRLGHQIVAIANLHPVAALGSPSPCIWPMPLCFLSVAHLVVLRINTAVHLFV